jgi:hypothetical protein
MYQAQPTVSTMYKISKTREVYRDCNDVQQAIDYLEALIAADQPVVNAFDWVLAPHYRGYANLGTGMYVINCTDAPAAPELVISIASEEDKKGDREIGEERFKDAHVIQPEDMAVRIAFQSVAALDALESGLLTLRKEHFPETVQQQVKDAERDYKDMRRMQEKFIKADQELREIRVIKRLTDESKIEIIHKWAESKGMREQDLIGLCDAIEVKIVGCNQGTCTSNCSVCKYASIRQYDGWCYMFKTEPDGVCGQFVNSCKEFRCETCSGKGSIDERLGGEWNSNPKAQCPDCDGDGVLGYK